MHHPTDPAWNDPLRDFTAPPLTADVEADVCVVGAGVAGLTTAYLLAKAGKRVVVVDANTSPGGGETRFTTAHLASAIDDRFTSVAKVRGEGVAKLAYESHAAAVDAIERIVRAEAIDCAFKRLDGFLFPDPATSDDTIAEEYDAARAAGADVERVDGVPVRTLSTSTSLRFRRQGRIQPSQYTAGLWKAAERHGVKFYGLTRVRDVAGGSPCQVRTDRTATVTAGAVVVATNTPVHTRTAMHTKLAPYMTYVIAAPVPRATVPDALYWDTADPYHYVRLVPAEEWGVRENEDLLVIGGADHKAGQERDPAHHWDELEEWARERFPDLGAVEYRWSGMVMETLDGLGYIGADTTGEANVYLATGDSGMGMTHGTIAGLLLTDLILGRPNPWAEAYDPNRLPVRSSVDFVTDGAEMAWQYRDWLTRGDVPTADAVKPGEGAVVRSGLTKLAVYREPSGALHMRSAVCPHLGAIVRWNPAEETWDCPAHGSRFAKDGRCIHGPSTADLAIAEQPEAAK